MDQAAGIWSRTQTGLLDFVAGHVRVTGAKPRAVTTDRDMISRTNEAALSAMGVTKVALPGRGTLSPERRPFERRRAFRRLMRWRSGQGALIHTSQGPLNWIIAVTGE